MNKSKTQKRSRQRRCKLSQRMKKRGGVGHNSRVRISSIVNSQVDRPVFMEPHPHGKVYKPSSSFIPTNYKSEGQHTIFHADIPVGRTMVTVNTRLDEDKQRNAYDRFNLKFQRIQDRNIDRLNKGTLAGNTQWVRVRAGVDKGLWQPTDGTWKMLPIVLSGYYHNNDFESLVKPDDISRDNLKKKFWVPSKYIYPPPVQTTSSDMDRYD